MNEEMAREIAIQILDEFEALLAAKGIKIPSDDREGREEEACLYGREYYDLEDRVVGVLVDEAAAHDEEARAACEAMRRQNGGGGSATWFPIVYFRG